jgi:Na+-driven multidrug efflux pump
MNGPSNPHATTGIWWGMFFSNMLSFLMIYFWYIQGKWSKARIKEIKK